MKIDKGTYRNRKQVVSQAFLQSCSIKSKLFKMLYKYISHLNIRQINSLKNEFLIKRICLQNSTKKSKNKNKRLSSELARKIAKPLKIDKGTYRQFRIEN